MPDLYWIDDEGYFRYKFHGGQWDAWHSQARFVCILSGTQGGKTTFGPPWLYREIKEKGPGDYLVATPTFPLLYVKALPEFRKLFERTLKLGRFITTPIRRFEFSRFGLESLFGPDYANAATTIYFGHANDPDSLEAATYKAAWLDEAGQKKFKLGSWESIQRRLSIYEGRVLFTTTPYYLGWLKRLVADRAAFDPDFEIIRFESIKNPAFPKTEWDRMQKLLPEWKFNLYYRALWSRPAGLIYDNWLDADQIKPSPIPGDWPRFVGIDFGGVNTAALFYAQNPKNGTYYAYKTYYPQEKKTSAEHVAAILQNEPEGITAVGGAKSEDQWRMEFKAAGLVVKKPPISDVEVGIDRVYAAHAERKIKVFNNLAAYIDEKESYSRVLDDAGVTTGEIEDKADYHLMDCERYLWALLGEDRGEGESVVIPPKDEIGRFEW
ncbi:terminase large subunit domain-containing protein [Chloroflexota bacterium]